MFGMKWAKKWRRLLLRLGTPSWMAEMARRNLTKLGYPQRISRNLSNHQQPSSQLSQQIRPECLKPFPH